MNKRYEKLQIAYDSLVNSNKTQAKIIKEKDIEIKKLVKENTSIKYRLRVIENKYNKILREALKIEEEDNEKN